MINRFLIFLSNISRSVKGFLLLCIDAIVLSIDSDERKISLGAKQLTEDPWDKIEEKYSIGAVVNGKVINLTQFGAFV